MMRRVAARRVWRRYSPTLTVLSLVAVIALVVMYWPNITGSINQVGLVGQAMYRARKFDKIVERIPQRSLWDAPDDVFEEQFSEAYLMNHWGIKTNSIALARWVMEILPYYVREGVAQDPVVPGVIAYYPSAEDRYHFNISGIATHGLFFLNYRYHNFASPWYGADELGTIVHELGHVQGVMPRDIKDEEEVREMEASNQVCTVEVLAAMSNDGNVYATRALAVELRGWSMAYSRHYLNKWGLGWVYELYNTRAIYTKPDERAGHARGLRFWEDKEDELENILYAYSVVPYRWAFMGVEHGETIPLVGGIVQNRRIEMDDLAYWIAHAKPLSRYAARAWAE